MTLLAQIASVWRDYAVPGVPASGDHDPVKSEIRAQQAALVAAIGGEGIGEELAEDIGTVAAQMESVAAAAAAAAADRIAAQTAASSAALNAALTAADAAAAESARGQAVTAAESADVSRYYDTLAEAEADLANIAANAVVHVWEDEDHSNHRTAYRKESGSLVFKKDLDNAWMASALGGTIHYVDSYVDPANGVMADTIALREALAAAGSGGVVRGKRGRTYTLCGSVEPAYGQTVEGMGATLKRCDAITATTATGIASGVSTSVTVDDASAFRVGMDIAVQSSATAGTGNRRITSIVGNVITVSVAFDATIASGATLTTSFAQVFTPSGDYGPLKVRGWEIDGNKANNSGFTNWVNHQEINIHGAGVVVEHNYVHDAVGEGIYAYAGSGSDTSPDPYVVQFNRVKDCNGNGIHMSAATSGKILYNWVKNTNLRPNGALGHDDACIAFSFNGPDWQVVGNYCENGLAGIGDLGVYPYTGDGLIAHNVVRDCETPIGRQLFAQAGGRVQVIANRFYDSGVWSLTQTDVYDEDFGFDNVTVALNHFYNSRLAIARSRDINLAGNRFVCDGDTSNNIVDIFDSRRITMHGNQITGGAYGVYIAGANCDAVRLKDNDCFDNYAVAVALDASTASGAVDISNQGIFVASGFTTSAAWIGAVLSNGSSYKGGKIKAANTSSEAAILCPDGGTGVRGAIVTGVEIEAPSVTYAVRAGGGSKNNIVVGNFSDGDFSNAGGADNTFENNYPLLVAA